jgi:hypothetical protein
MKESLLSYSQGRTSLGSLVSSLEGALDAGEFNDESFTGTFYELWAVFEVTYATQLYNREEGLEAPLVEPGVLRNEIDAFLTFLRGCCPDNPQDDGE